MDAPHIRDLIEREIVLSTCQKRIVVCVLLDDESVIRVSSNRCTPFTGACTRLDDVTAQAHYPMITDCRSEHAEARAIHRSTWPLPHAERTAVILGHTFPCEPCETALRNVGVSQIYVIPDYPGTGMRS